MEFIDYHKASEMLQRVGVVAEPAGDLIELRFQPPEDSEAEVRKAILAPAPDESLLPGAATQVVPADRLPAVAEEIASRLHLPEYALIPSSNWKAVLDIAAFELAQHEAWLDIDAEAAMHQTGRDPLLLDPNHRHLLGPFVKAIAEHADSPGERLFVTSLEAPFLLTVHQSGALLVCAASEEMIEKIITAA